MTIETKGHSGASIPSEANRLAHEARHAAGEQATALWEDARQAARAKVAEQKQSAASTIDDFASALRATGQRSGRQDSASRLTQSAANELERLSGTLRNKDVDDMLREGQRFARRQPLAFFAAAVAAGFVAVRFLKSSESGGEPRDRHRFDDEQDEMSQQAGGYATARGAGSTPPDRYAGNSDMRSASPMSSDETGQYGQAQGSMFASPGQQAGDGPARQSTTAPDETGAFIGSRQGLPASSSEATSQRQMSSEQMDPTYAGRQRQP